jgi:hypothetical protein
MPVSIEADMSLTSLSTGSLGSIPGISLASRLLATVCSATGAKTPEVLLLYESFFIKGKVSVLMLERKLMLNSAMATALCPSRR